jgi:TatD DNase family protein
VWTDTHCHLDASTWGGDEAVDALVARAKEAGVSRMVAIGTGYSAESFGRARAVAERHSGVWFTAGVHPHDAQHWGPSVEAELRAELSKARRVALGEVGLDFHYDLSDRDAQRSALRAQVLIACELDIPLVIHDRSSGGETLEILLACQAFRVRVLYHCFSGDRAELAAIAAAGAYVSIPGIVTFKNADEMREVARSVPDDRLLVETDSPYLAPVPHRGRRNEPAFVAHVGAFVAGLRGVTPEALAAQTTANALRFYGLPDGAW